LVRFLLQVAYSSTVRVFSSVEVEQLALETKPSPSSIAKSEGKHEVNYTSTKKQRTLENYSLRLSFSHRKLYVISAYIYWYTQAFEYALKNCMSFWVLIPKHQFRTNQQIISLHGALLEKLIFVQLINLFHALITS